MKGRLLPLLLLAGSAAPVGAAPTRPSAAPAPATPATPPNVGGISLAVPAGTPYTTVSWPEGGGTVYGRVEALSWSVRAGAGESLDSFRRDHPDWSFGEPRRVQVCGVDALRLDASAPARELACVEFADGTPSRPEHQPPGLAAAVVFPWQGVPVRVTVEGRAEDGAALAAARDQLLGSIRCEAGPSPAP